ncbi:hypothetical protein HD806DRAFT_65943 [Xylariaceae sp. AK1471]|nr:hypothetical protein HD806DRAFT_65943 [Xylariaceae sp. AK1471]
MPETLQSILCGETWVWDSQNSCQITFDANETGKLIFRSEASVFIAAEFDWELALPSSASSPTPSTSTATPTSALTAISIDLTSPSLSPSQTITLSLKITLSKRRIPYLGDLPTSRIQKLNEDLLHDSAFLPRTYSVRLERGDFIPTADVRRTQPQRALSDSTLRYALRLVFDPSPYPPAEAWKDPRGGPVAIKPWEFTEFCGRPCGTVAGGGGGGSSSAWGLGQIFGALRGRAWE